MGKFILQILLLSILLSACQSSNGGFMSGNRAAAKQSAPSGKYRNPTMFSRANPFQGRAKANLNKSKRKKLKFFKRKHKQRGKYRKWRKPGRSFSMKRTVSRSRLKSSGSRMKGGSGAKRKNKNLFNTRKK